MEDLLRLELIFCRVGCHLDTFDRAIWCWSYDYKIRRGDSGKLSFTFITQGVTVSLNKEVVTYLCGKRGCMTEDDIYGIENKPNISRWITQY